jgi:hypothetical protein
MPIAVAIAPLEMLRSFEFIQLNLRLSSLPEFGLAALRKDAR